MRRLGTFIAAALMAASAFGAGSSVGATRSWTSNYVASVMASIGEPASVSNLVRDVMADMLNSSVSALGGYEDDATISTNGSAVFYVAVQYQDSFVLERREYDVSVSQTNVPPCYGCRVVSSAVSTMPTGTLYAVTSDGLRLRNVGAAQDELEIYSTTNGWRIYGVGPGAVYDSVDLFDGGRVRVGVWTNGVLRGTFTVQPWALTEAEASACLGGEPSGYNAWANLATNRHSVVDITFSTPLDADESSGVQGGISFSLNYVGPGFIDYEEVYGSDDDHYWSPRFGYPPGEWENPLNWISFPLTATISYDDAGVTRTRTVSISSMAMLQKYLEKVSGSLSIPPFGYTYPVLKRYVSFECQKFGHVWRSCVCEVCGEMRAHDFRPENEYECDRCQNKDSDRKRTDDGEWEVFEIDRKCGQYETEGVMDHHRGWHHVSLGEESDGWEEFYCSCQCGCYSPNTKTLGHDLQPTGEQPEQYDEDYHKVYSACSRCQHRAYKLEEHTPDFTAQDLQLEYYDREQHTVVGKCSKCDAEIRGLRYHNWGYYGDVNYCCCPCFFTIEGVSVAEGEYPLMHSTPVYRADTNPHDMTRTCEGEVICERCGQKLEDVSMEFPPLHYFGYETDGSPDGEGNDSYHYCACSNETEPHEDSFYDDEIGVCNICGRTRGDDKMRGGRPGNDSKTSKDPSVSDPTPPTDDPNSPYGPNGPFDPRGPKPDNPDDPDNPDNPENPDNPDNPTPPDPPFPPLPDLPNIPFGGNSSMTIDPNVNVNNWVRVTF